MDLNKSRDAYQAWRAKYGHTDEQEGAGSDGEKEVTRAQYKSMTITEQAAFLESGGKVVDGDDTSGDEGHVSEPQTPEEEARALRSQVNQLTEQVNKLTSIAEKQLALQIPRLTRDKMTVTEKVDYIQKHGQSAYLDLPLN